MSMSQASAVTSALDSLRQNTGVRGAAGEQDHLGQLVEELDGASRQLCQALDGCGVNFLGTVSAHTESQVVQAQGNEVKPRLHQATVKDLQVAK